MKYSYRFPLIPLLSFLIVSLLFLPRISVSAKDNIKVLNSNETELLSIDDQLQAALVEAAEALGGGFTTDNSHDHYLTREKQVGMVGDQPAIRTDILDAGIVDSTTCNTLKESNSGWESYTFHGMEACILKDANSIYSMVWYATNEHSLDGMGLSFYVASFITYCGGSEEAEAKLGFCEKNRGLKIAEALHQAAINNGLYEVATEEIVKEEVTEEATQEVVVVPYGGETEEPNTEVVVVPYGGESQEETTAEGGFEETWDSEQAKAIRSPYLPILGGLFGGGAAWLLSRGAANASSYASTVTNYVKTLPQTAAPEIPQAPPELVTELPELVTTPPKLETEPPKNEKTETPEEKKDEPVSAGKLALNLVKEAVNTTGNIDGVYFKYLAGKDSQEVVEAIRKAVKLWHEAPSAESAAAYMEALKSSNALKDSKLGGKLGILSKGIDLLEAVIDTANISQERGYDGWETAATAYAKV